MICHKSNGNECESSVTVAKKSARKIPGKFIIVNAQHMISGRGLAGEDPKRPRIL